MVFFGPKNTTFRLMLCNKMHPCLSNNNPLITKSSIFWCLSPTVNDRFNGGFVATATHKPLIFEPVNLKADYKRY